MIYAGYCWNANKISISEKKTKKIYRTIEWVMCQENDAGERKKTNTCNCAVGKIRTQHTIWNLEPEKKCGKRLASRAIPATSL